MVITGCLVGIGVLQTWTTPTTELQQTLLLGFLFL